MRITISCDFIIDTQAQFSYKIHGQNSGKQLFIFHQICHIMIPGYQDLFVCCGAFIQNFYDVVHPEGNIYGLLPPPALSETFFCIYVLRISRTMKIASSCIMKIYDCLRNRLQILLLILSEFRGINYFYSPWNYQNTVGFLMISGGIEVN